ncbi:AMP-binding protein [Georgenia sp. SYP-B2076]|uniref:AMP-binding protein n=1 Tax=Georgenia sp. SYP-B2076 TaxID=2495881 RepID=UPI000F8D8105|nr:AMP-binding protein [Georgenia sp. SYP-B2076]
MRDTLWHAYRHSLDVHRGRTAIELESGDRYTYDDLDVWSAAVAEQLADTGVGTGDAVALYLRNGVEFVVADIAIARLGAVKVPVNYMLPESTVRYIVETSGATAVVASESLIAPLADRADGADGPALFQVGGQTAAAPSVQMLAGREHRRGDDVRSTATASSPAAIYFTGGTTGRPKGVVHTQASTVSLHYAQMLEAEITDSERLLLMTPLAHAAGLFTQTALLRGATVILTDGFDAAKALLAIRNAGITWTFLVPTMIYRILDLVTPDDYQGALRTVVYGAAPMAPVRLEQALSVFGPVFIQLYGQTENPNWGTRLSKADHDTARPGLLASCGQASIMCDVQIVDPDGNPVPAGTTGEICLSSPYTLDSYLDDAPATEDKFIGSWIRTGDIGVMDDAGYVYLKDRKNDMIISGGMNVYGREVEDAIATHPGVVDVAVIGIPHEDWGEAVHACVVTSDPAMTPEDLLAWVRPRLAAYARPKSVEILSSLPETPFGKIDKKTLRAPYWVGAERAIG